jgi:hypothetical protein
MMYHHGSAPQAPISVKRKKTHVNVRATRETPEYLVITYLIIIRFYAAASAIDVVE